MAHLVIPIPARSDRSKHPPRLSFSGGGNSSPRVTVSYADGEITFTGVLECRWIKWGVRYEDHPEHEADNGSGLLQIVDSAYLAAMASQGWFKTANRAVQLADGVVPHHYRLTFDGWGVLNVISTDRFVRSSDAPIGE